ncbi:MAG: GntR family transcriptional regulator [Solirubrobacteraceae bacterium]
MEAVSTGPSTTAQHALDALRRAILAGELRPGERVGQDEFAQQLGVSIAPVREALRILEQEGQVTYLPRRGYFVTELRMADLQEIYALRAVLEARAARRALASLDEVALQRIRRAAADCARAVDGDDVLGELEANRRFHMAVLEPAAAPHTLRLIRLLWESTEAYRALYYNSPQERCESLEAHDRMLDAIRDADADRLIAEMDDHRNRTLTVLGALLD